MDVKEANRSRTLDAPSWLWTSVGRVSGGIMTAALSRSVTR